MSKLKLVFSWKKMLYSDDYRVQLKAVNYVIQSKKLAAIKYLLNVLEQDKNHYTAEKILDNFSELDFLNDKKRYEVISFLKIKLSDTNTRIELLQKIIQLLPRLDYELWEIENFIQLLYDLYLFPDKSIEQKANQLQNEILNTFKKIKNHKTYEILLECLLHDDINIRYTAAHIISYNFDDIKFKKPELSDQIAIWWYSNSINKLKNLNKEALPEVAKLITVQNNLRKKNRYYEIPTKLIEIFSDNPQLLSEALKKSSPKFAFEFLELCYGQKIMFFDVFVAVVENIVEICYLYRKKELWKNRR